MLKLGNIFLTLLTVLAVAIVLATAWLSHEVNKQGSFAEDKIIYIRSGSSIKAIAKQCVDEGLAESELVFMIAARWRNMASSLKSGEYKIPAGASIQNIITQMQEAKTYQHQVTIPEGLMAVEIAEILKANEVLTGELEKLPLEGSLMPETYSFSRGDTRQSIINRMQAASQKIIDDLWEKRSAGLPFKTKNEALVLASVVEKETGIAGERAKVAGVFINRLNKGIALQSDPTVIYAVTEGKKKLERPLTFKDLDKKSPYNTYAVRGLPPSPIANPGKLSLAAVLNPEQHKYLYFVADGTGGHVFAQTLEEHNRNVQKWRKIKKNL